MTPEELDEARAKEAWRIWHESEEDDALTTSIIAARLAREGWTPPEPEPVDPDMLAWMAWMATQSFSVEWQPQMSIAFLAGARMAREQERERAKPLVNYVDYHAVHNALPRARAILAEYRGEA